MQMPSWNKQQAVQQVFSPRHSPDPRSEDEKPAKREYTHVPRHIPSPSLAEWEHTMTSAHPPVRAIQSLFFCIAEKIFKFWLPLLEFFWSHVLQECDVTAFVKCKLVGFHRYPNMEGWQGALMMLGKAI
jgi:hypothetical protein